MKKENMDEYIIKNYQEEEKMMILIYAQFCVNHDLDPVEIYKEAYPNEEGKDSLIEALELTVAKEEADPISDDLVLQSLQAFGNDDLAFILYQRINKPREK